MKYLRPITLPFILLVLLGCSPDDEFLTLTNVIDATGFSVNTPPGWELIQDQGIDTYIGRIAGPEDTVYFDFGHLSFKSLDDITRDDQTLYLEGLFINNVASIIHKEERPDDMYNEIRLSVYLESDDGKNRLYAYDSENEALILQIFKSHRFK